MKKLFFLFAAAALLTACSSDELSETTGGGGTPTNPNTEQIVSAQTVEFNNGVEVAVGALDNATATRAADNDNPEGHVNFVINLNKLNVVNDDGEVVSDVLKDFGDYKLKVDDFAIRRDGKYVNDITPVNNKYTYYTIEMVEDSLKVAVKNLDLLKFEDSYDQCKDYTFEFYLWIENKKLDTENGTGGFVERFGPEEKVKWIQKEWPVAEGEDPGCDLSHNIWRANGENGNNFFEEGAKDCGLLVRYNVYRGLQGVDGNTPYIKVSVHVEKKDQNTPNSIKNECTWVRIPYTPNKSLSKDSSDILSVK